MKYVWSKLSFLLLLFSLPSSLYGAATSWTVNLDNTALTFSAIETVNGVTVCGTLAYPSTNFIEFTVKASVTVLSVSCATAGALAPTVGTVFYGLSIPGVALVTYPIETTELELVYMVQSGPCPTANFNSLFLFNQEDPNGNNNFTSNSQPGFGTFTWTSLTSTGDITNLYNLSAATPIAGFSSFHMAPSSACTGGIYSIPGAGNRGGIMYMNTQGTAVFRTNANKGIFVLPQITVEDITEVSGYYSVLGAVNGLAGVSGYNGLSGAVQIQTYRLGVAPQGTDSTGNVVDPGTGNPGATAGFTLTGINDPANGFVRGTFTQGGFSGALTCAVYLNSQNTLFCQGQNPAQTTNAVNLVLVGDSPPIFSRPAAQFNSMVNAIATAVDSANLGKLYIGGDFTTYNGTTKPYIARFNSDTSLDTSFATVGTGLDGNVYAIAVALDSTNMGKVYLGGNFTHYGVNVESFIARLNTDGSLDATFAPTGTLNGTVETIDALPNGTVYIGGLFGKYGATSEKHIARLTPTGALDSTFVTGAGFTLGSPTVYSIVTALDSTGNIYVGGEFNKYKGVAADQLVRLDSTGTMDAAFLGATALDYAVLTIAPAVDTANTGKIYIGGYFGNYNATSTNAVARLNSNGTLDTTFLLKGTGFDEVVSWVAPALDSGNVGKLYVAGDFSNYNGTAITGLARLNSDGSLDTTFIWGAGFNTGVTVVLAAQDSANLGKVYAVGGFPYYNYQTASGIVRLNSNASIDSSAFAVAPGSGLNGGIFSLAPATDSINLGKIYIGGDFTMYNGSSTKFIARFNYSGTPDWSFSPSGTGLNGDVTAIGNPTDSANLGKIYIGGYFTAYNGVAENYVARLNTDGSLDSSFTTGTGTAGLNLDLLTIAPATDGSGNVYVGGDFTKYNATTENYIARLTSTGALDMAFAQTGTGLNDTVYSIVPLSDGSGKMYVGGSFSLYNTTTENGIARLKSNGKLDATFSTGTVGLSGGPVYTMGTAIDSVNLGKIYVGGEFELYNTTTENYIARLNTDGSLDTTFATGVGLNGYVQFIAPASDSANLGKIYVGGAFSTYDTTTTGSLVRLNSDGSLDTTFLSSGSGIDALSGDQVNAILLATDYVNAGKVYVGGQFSFFNTTGAANILRLSSTGLNN